MPGIPQAMFDGAQPGHKLWLSAPAWKPARSSLSSTYASSSIRSSYLSYAQDEFAGTLGNIAAVHIDMALLITGRAGLNDVQAAFDDLANPEAHAKTRL
jgi:hypothetical protein